MGGISELNAVCGIFNGWVDVGINRGNEAASKQLETTVIRHIVFFTARQPEHLDEIVAGLKLLATIPHARHLEVARNTKVDQISNEVDVVVYAEFADEEALKAYKAHPTYAEATRLVRPLRDLRLSADFPAQT